MRTTLSASTDGTTSTTATDVRPGRDEGCECRCRRVTANTDSGLTGVKADMEVLPPSPIEALEHVRRCRRSLVSY